MFKNEAKEAAPILQRALQKMLGALPASSDPELALPRANLRTACGQLIAYAEPLIQDDAAGEPLDNCFDLAIDSGIDFLGLRYVYDQASSEAPVTVGATMVKNSIIQLSLAHAARVLATMTFTSRDEVDALKLQTNDVFNPAEEEAADDMAQMTYRALVQLHAAAIFYLTETARPLPRMLRWQFATVMPTLMLAQRLYYDAGRADELRAENHVVHPAFAPIAGRALSS